MEDKLNFSIDFLTPTSTTTVMMVIAAVIIGALVIRLIAGPPAEIARRAGLLIIRCLIIGLVLLLLVNPVQVTETSGNKTRPEVFYLLDTSTSMQLGTARTRWDDVVQMIRDAETATQDTPADVNLFRFGHRLSSIDGLASLGIGQLQGQPVVQASSGSGTADGATQVVTPDDADTRLLMALRQLTSRFGRSPPASIVLFSDGRARDGAGIEEVARHFSELDVPIHVVPVGELTGSGDVALVAAVVPETVRRHSRVEVQVFLRSYGYDGQRAEVQLKTVGTPEAPSRILGTPQPVTLRSGFQPVTLSFRADEDTRDLLIEVPILPGEVSTQNNLATAETFIEQTKIRVLYVEGSRQLPRAVRRGEAIVVEGPYSDLYKALASDLDVECVVVSGSYGNLRRLVVADGSLDSQRGFPESSAELSAFDGLILSNVRRDQFTDEQIGWIERWVNERGGGLCMVGGPSSFASGGWNDTEIEKMLPVLIQDGQEDWDPSVEVAAAIDTTGKTHPIWNMVDDVAKNRTILESFPAFEGTNLELRVKSALAESLATAKVGSRDRMPVVAVGRYGKGRTMALSTAITAPWANAFLNDWGEGDSRYYLKFWRNVVYWMTESSDIGRRRLIAEVDKNYYRPGDKIQLRAVAYDEGANLTQDYRIEVMVEPQSAELDDEALYSPILWPDGMPREEGYDGRLAIWGEQIVLPKLNSRTAGPLGASDFGYGIELQINDILSAGAAKEGLRIELTAMEDQTQVDSTSMQIQLLHDPFEQQNPFPNHDLLKTIADTSGGKVVNSARELAALISDLPITAGPPTLSRSPLWSSWWVWSLLVGMLTVEWLWRRYLGLA